MDDKDREAYERGLEVNEQNIVSRFISDRASYLGNSESEKAAYDKARKGEQLDDDKKDDE